jgi:hypothetical protein
MPISDKGGEGRGMLEWELINSQSPSSVSSVTFSGLDGNADGEYLLKGVLSLPSSGTSSGISMYLNGDNVTTDKWWMRHAAGYDFSGVATIHTSGYASSASTYHPISPLTSSVDNFLVFETIICASAGYYRYSLTDATLYSTSAEQKISYMGSWTDTTTNLTSLLFSRSSSLNMNGKLDLYRKVVV